MYEKTTNTQNILKLIYIIEDDFSISNIIKEVLKNEGYEVKVFSTIKSLLLRFETYKPDLLIMDINLPEGNHAGIKFLQHVKKDIPCIMITGYDNIHNRTESAIYGAKYYLKKPIIPQTLTQKVESILN